MQFKLEVDVASAEIFFCRALGLYKLLEGCLASAHEHFLREYAFNATECPAFCHVSGKGYSASNLL